MITLGSLNMASQAKDVARKEFGVFGFGGSAKFGSIVMHFYAFVTGMDSFGEFEPEATHL